jgi:hypothetical protein
VIARSPYRREQALLPRKPSEYFEPYQQSMLDSKEKPIKPRKISSFGSQIGRDKVSFLADQNRYFDSQAR